MRAIRYRKSVPRYLTARLLGPKFPALYTSRLACLQFTEIEPQPLPGEEWLRVRPILSGICGSDIASLTAKGSPYFSPFSSCPFVFGHEIVGEVAEKGSQCGDFKAGDRVVLHPPLTCRIRQVEPPCPACASGRETHCQGMTRGILSAGVQTGFCRDTGGGWSDSFVAHRLQLHKVPEWLSDEAAVLVEPFSCALCAALKAVPLTAEKRILIQGFGTMGVLTLAALKALGSRSRVIVVAKHRYQQELAREWGADAVVAPGPDFYLEIGELLGLKSYQPELGGPVLVGGVDVCFDCVASDRTLDDSLRLTVGGGTVVLVGMPSIPQGIDWTAIWFKELKIVGSYTCDRTNFERALRELAGMESRMAPLVGATFALERYKEALAGAMNTGRSQVTKTAFRL